MDFLHTNRVVVLVDMDCFYCQVEEKLNPALVGKPIAVVQYNAWKGGGIIAVNYPARDRGVTRHMRGHEAKKKCPDIVLVSVPTLREKADLTKYRDAGKDVAAVLNTFTDLLERASVDEAYMDITDAVNKRIAANYPITVDRLKNTHVVGYDIKDFIDSFKYEHYIESNLKLCVGGIIAEEIRAAVLEKTGYKCSAGIAHNKILAKLACGLHKPNKQSILTQDAVDGLFETLPLRKIRSLGGKFGYNLGEDLGITTMGELKKFTEKELISRYDEKAGSWLYNIARGIDQEPVITRLVSKSIGCCKKFPGKSALCNPKDVLHWIKELSAELSERLLKDLEENNRKAKNMVVGFVQTVNKRDISATRTHYLASYEPDKIATDMLKVVNKNCLSADGFYHIKYLGISAGKFEDCKKKYDISSFFKNCNTMTKRANIEPECDLFDLSSSINSGVQVNQTNFTATEINTDDFHGSKSPKENTNLIENIENEEVALSDDKGFDGESRSDLNLTSAFLEDTILLDINESALIFNENYKNVDGFFTDAVTATKNKDSETDSITDEIENIEVEGTSYFSNYFINMKLYNRNFDTSKYLQENDANFDTDSSSYYETNSSSASESSGCTKSVILDTHENASLAVSSDTSNNFRKLVPSGSTPDISKRDTDKNINVSSLNYQRFYSEACEDSTKERCKECNKLLPATEMPAHMDYHYALQIVRDEAHLYNNQANLSTCNPSRKLIEIKSNKKKKSKIASTKLTSFFENSTQTSSNTPTETCPHCNKDIPTDGFFNHLDYHAAKKLHSELNPIATMDTIGPSGTTSSNKNKKFTKRNEPKNILSFFKQKM